MLGLVLVALSALLSGGARAEAKNPDTLVYAQFWDLGSLDPAWSGNMSPLYNVYEPLVDFRGAGFRAEDLEPILASTVPSRANGLISRDGRVYRFPIRAGVRFHDGATLTPEDVRYSLLRFMLTESAEGQSSALLRPLVGVGTLRGKDGQPDAALFAAAERAVRVDGDAVVLALARPFAPLLTVLANFGRVIEKRCAIAHGQWDSRAETWTRFSGLSRAAALPDDADCGTGPFRVERLDKAGRQLVLARFENYWRKPARLKRVIIRYVPELVARRLMLEAGDADVIAVAPRDAEQFKGERGVTVLDGLFKLQDAPLVELVRRARPKEGDPFLGSGQLDGDGVPPDFFSDPDVRAGFAAALDRETYAREVARSSTTPGALIPAGLPGHLPSAPRFDPATARAHFKKAFDGRLWEKGFRVAFVYPAIPDERVQLGELLRADLAAVNPKFVVEPRSVPVSSWLAMRLERRFALQFDQWTADYPDPHDFAFPMVHSQGLFSRLSGFSSPEADRLVEEGAAAPDGPARAAAYEKLSALVDRELPFILLPSHAHARVQRSWVKGFVFDPARHNLPYDSYYYDLYKSDAP